MPRSACSAAGFGGLWACATGVGVFACSARFGARGSSLSLGLGEAGKGAPETVVARQSLAGLATARQASASVGNLDELASRASIEAGSDDVPRSTNNAS